MFKTSLIFLDPYLLSLNSGFLFFTVVPSFDEQKIPQVILSKIRINLI